MIVFYEQATGTIVGAIHGRIHDREHEKLWIGENTGRIVVNWTHIGQGKFVPDHHQPDLFQQFDSNPSLIYGYVVVKKQGKHFLTPKSP